MIWVVAVSGTQCVSHLTTAQIINLASSINAITRARTTHCRSRHFCRILFGPPNFFMSLQKSHCAQSSVRLQGSHSPHMRAERFTCNKITPKLYCYLKKYKYSIQVFNRHFKRYMRKSESSATILIVNSIHVSRRIF